MTNAIEVETLTKYYGDPLAVDHISFEVRQGEVFGFLGPNGVVGSGPTASAVGAVPNPGGPATPP